MPKHVQQDHLHADHFDIDTSTDEVTVLTPNYSTTEHVTGEQWLSGETVYRKVINFGALPNTATKNVAHGITGLDTVISLEGVARNTIIGNYLPLSYPTGTARVELLIQGSDIRVVTDSNFSDWTETYVIMKYTKTM